MDENERYTEICKPAFDGIKDDTAEILRILKGSNGDPGLIDEVRNLKKFRKTIVGTVGFVLTVLFVQGVTWLRSRFSGG